MENPRTGNPRHFRSLENVALTSSLGVMAENYQNHMVKYWVSLPSSGDGARV